MSTTVEMDVPSANALVRTDSMWCNSGTLPGSKAERAVLGSIFPTINEDIAGVQVAAQMSGVNYKDPWLILHEP
jgi:hypothetical protein